MKLTFLGTGTSMGVPTAGGFSYDKPSEDPRDFRYRVSAYLETKYASILIDIGPDFRFQTLRSGIKKIDLLLITHEHSDHITGLDDLRPFNYVQKSAIKTITSEQCKNAIKQRFFYMFEPNKTLGSVDLDFIDVNTFSTFTFNEVHITPFPVMHGKMEIWGFKIDDLVYITDASFISEEVIAFCRNCKVLIINGLRMNPDHPTHFTIPETIEIIKQIQPEKAFIVHMNSQVKQAELRSFLPANTFFAHDLLVHEW